MPQWVVWVPVALDDAVRKRLDRARMTLDEVIRIQMAMWADVPHLATDRASHIQQTTTLAELLAHCTNEKVRNVILSVARELGCTPSPDDYTRWDIRPLLDITEIQWRCSPRSGPVTTRRIMDILQQYRDSPPGGRPSGEPE